MNFFGSTDTVDGKARTVLGDLSEDSSPYEILDTVDQKAGEDVDPDDVVSKMREIDDAVDAKLADIEGEAVDQKDMRAAADTIASRTPLSQPAAMQLLSAVVDSVTQMDPTEFVDAFDSTVATTAVDEDDIDQHAQETTSGDTDGNPEDGETDAKADTDTPDMGTETDQKQENEDEQNDMNPVDLVEEIGGEDVRETVEEYADAVGKDTEEAAAEWVAENVPGVTVEGYGNEANGDAGGEEAAAGGGGAPTDPGTDANAATGPDRTGGDEFDQKLREQVADAVTSDDVLEEMAGEVAQKMASDEELADQLVETVDQKGDFATTDDTVVTAPAGESETVEESGAITGGDTE